MRNRHHARTIRALPVLALALLAMLGVVLSASFLGTAASAPDATPGLSQQPPVPEFTHDTDPGPATQHHDEAAGVYTAQSLFRARWDIGAVQAGWNHRPVWESPVTGQGVRVAIIDTGVDAGHPDLQGRVVAWKDFVGGHPQPYDDSGHGTHVAGIIAGGGHTQLRPDHAYFLTGARGIAPDAEIIAAKAMDEHGRGDPNRIAEAILWSLDPHGDGAGAHIINLSLGIALEDPGGGDGILDDAAQWNAPRSGSMGVVEDAIQKAHEQGAIIVVSAGNHEPGEPGRILFPGTMDEVITVGAVDPDGQVAPFSNTGPRASAKPDLVAPGVVVSTDAQQTDRDDVPRYRGLGGTSMAAPFVAGTLALILEADPTLQEQSRSEDKSGNTKRARALLTQSATPIPGSSPEEQGAGLLRVDAALRLAGTGDGSVRPAAYAAPLLVAVGGYWVVRRRTSLRPGTGLAEKRAKSPDRAPDFPDPAAQKKPVGPPTSGFRGPHLPARPLAGLPRPRPIYAGAHAPRRLRASIPLTPTPTVFLVDDARPPKHRGPRRPLSDRPSGRRHPRRAAGPHVPDPAPTARNPDDSPGSTRAPWD